MWRQWMLGIHTSLLLYGHHEVLNQCVLRLLQLEQCLADLFVGDGWGQVVHDYWHDELLVCHLARV